MNKKLFIFCLLFLSSFNVSADRFNRYFTLLMKLEGAGFVVSKIDRAGISKYGVTLATAKFHFATMPSLDKDKDGRITKNDVRLFSKADVKPVYRSGYWNPYLLDSLKSEPLAWAISDMFINMGEGYKNKHLKYVFFVSGNKHLKLKWDISITNGLNKKDPDSLLHKIYEYRVSFYQKLCRVYPNQNIFIKGWIKRANKFTSITSINHAI